MAVGKDQVAQALQAMQQGLNVIGQALLGDDQGGAAGGGDGGAGLNGADFEDDDGDGNPDLNQGAGGGSFCTSCGSKMQKSAAKFCGDCGESTGGAAKPDGDKAMKKAAGGAQPLNLKQLIGEALDEKLDERFAKMGQGRKSLAKSAAVLDKPAAETEQDDDAALIANLTTTDVNEPLSDEAWGHILLNGTGKNAELAAEDNGADED